jgi:hypothetical protein
MSWMTFAGVILYFDISSDLNRAARQRKWSILEDLADPRNIHMCRELGRELLIEPEMGDVGAFIQYAAQALLDDRKREYHTRKLAEAKP